MKEIVNSLNHHICTPQSKIINMLKEVDNKILIYLDIDSCGLAQTAINNEKK